MGERVVLGRKGGSSMVKDRWTEKAPANLNDADDAQEMGAKWEGEELVTTTSKASWSSTSTTNPTTT